MIEKIKSYIAEAEAFQTQNKEELEAFRIKFLSKKGIVNDFMTEFKNVPNEQKKEFGQVINAFKSAVQNKVTELQDAMESKEEAKGVYGDLSRPGEPFQVGSRHPISIVKNQMIDIFF